VRAPIALSTWIITALAASTAAAAPGVQATPYDAGQSTLTVLASGRRINGETKLILGAGYGYFVLPGLELAAHAAVLVMDPVAIHVSPVVRYFLYPVDWSVRPFAGAFYRRWFLDGGDDYSAIGAELGLRWWQTARVAVTGAVVVEYELDCSRYDDCATFYPTLGVSIRF
jgi:hypothetical protein